MESMITLFVVLMMSLLLVAIASVRGINRGSALRSQAAMLADQELNALRRAGFASLPTQTDCGTPSNCPARNVLYNAGDWSVAADPSNAPDHSVPNVLALEGTAGITGRPSGILQLPSGRYGDVTLTSAWFVADDSVSNDDPDSGWSVGYYVRAVDARTMYRLRIGEYQASGVQTDYDTALAGVQNVYLEKVLNGAVSKLASANMTIAKGGWHDIELAVTGTTPVVLTLTVDGNAVPVLTATDAVSPIIAGSAALVGWNGVHAEIDDVQTAGPPTGTWNFDIPAAPTMPAGWIRLGVNGLPDATPTVYDDNVTVAIEPYPDGASTTLKQVTVTVSWLQRGTTQTFSTSTLIGVIGL